MGLVSHRGKRRGRHTWTDKWAPCEITERRGKKRHESVAGGRGRKNPLWSSGLCRSRQDRRTLAELASSDAAVLRVVVQFVGLRCFGGHSRKKKQFGPSLDGRCSRGSEGRSSWVGWPPPPPPSLSPSFTSPSTAARRDSVLRQLEPYVSCQCHAMPSLESLHANRPTSGK